MNRSQPVSRLVLPVLSTFLLSVFLLAGLGPAPTSADEPPVDLLDLASGAVVLEHSSAYSDDWHSLMLLDGTELKGWCVEEGAPFPHSVTIELAHTSKLEKIAFDTRRVEESGYPGISAREVEIWLSKKGPKEGYEKVLAVELPQAERTEFELPGEAVGRWLRLVVKSNWGYEGFTELMELEAQGRPVGDDPALPELAGVYITNYGRMLFEQQGRQVRGCYDWDGGVLTGTTDGRVVQFEWREDEGQQVGTALMVLSAGGETLNGLWFEGGSYRGLWQGPRATDGQKPNCTIGSKSAVEKALDESGHAILYGIHFDVNSDRLRPDSEPVLRDVLKALQSNEEMALVIEGHTDSTGSAEHNQSLSEQRAASVVKWLVDEGVSAERLEAQGFGASRPVADNGSVGGRALNRRVELKRQ